MDSPFLHKTALVTGASSGIGRAIALELAAGGAQLWLTSRSAARLQTLGADLRARMIIVDLSDPRQVEELRDELATKILALDVLVHSAGVIELGAMAQALPGDFDRQWQVNVRAPYVLTQALLPQLKACRGQVVFINSSAGRNGVPGSAQYCATKHALRGLADSLRGEVNGCGVRVLNVYVGRTATPMQALVHEYEGRAYRPESLIQPEDVASLVAHALALPATVEVTDLQLRPALTPKT